MLLRRYLQQCRESVCVSVHAVSDPLRDLQLSLASSFFLLYNILLSGGDIGISCLLSDIIWIGLTHVLVDEHNRNILPLLCEGLKHLFYGGVFSLLVYEEEVLLRVRGWREVLLEKSVVS